MLQKRKAVTKIPEPGSVSFEDRVKKMVPSEWGYGSTRRVGMLRDTMYWKCTSTKEWIDVFRNPKTDIEFTEREIEYILGKSAEAVFLNR